MFSYAGNSMLRSLMKSLVVARPCQICQHKIRDLQNQSISRGYSDWYRKRPPVNQIIADIDDEPYRTTVTIQNQTEEYLFVDSYSTFGFRLNNGFRIIGPVALFPKTSLAWNVTGAEDIHLESLSLFTVLEPKLDLLIVGVGEASEMKYVTPHLYKDLRNKGIGLELLPTHQACATYNFLNGEKRCVAAALLPPKKIVSRNMDEFMLPDNLDAFGSLDRPVNPLINPQTGKLMTDFDQIPEHARTESEKTPELAEKSRDDDIPTLPPGTKKEKP